MSIETLLNRLDRVKATGKNRWVASSPTRNDKTPSLAIRELDDGRVLVHDFGGSTPQQVLDAVGLTFQDLFPEKITQHGKPERRPFFASDLLRVIAFEALLTASAACRIASGNVLDANDRERLVLAAGRIREALQMGGIACL
jgi:hypothetical protein